MSKMVAIAVWGMGAPFTTPKSFKEVVEDFDTARLMKKPFVTMNIEMEQCYIPADQLDKVIAIFEFHPTKAGPAQTQQPVWGKVA
jgi:hypothetical protein